MADVVFGDVNPSARLSTSFPRNVGQCPIYYNHKNTGRPLADGAWFQKFRRNYIEIDNEPLYPFGFGLSYTTFSYSDVALDKTSMTDKGELTGYNGGYIRLLGYTPEMRDSLERERQEYAAAYQAWYSKQNLKTI